MAFRPAYGQVDRAYGMRMATMAPEEDGPILMVNLMRYRERAAYADGTDGGLTGKEADDKYAPVEVLNAIGAQVAFFGDVVEQLIGDPRWDRIGCVRYPTRRSFVEMQSRPDFREKHTHKEAGMAETIVMGCLPLELPERAADLRVDWADVPHPPTDDDGPIIVMHVLRFAEGQQDRARMADYQQAAYEVAAPHGVRIAGWYRVEGTIMGDGRSWDEVRFNAFPSRRAFMAVVTDPARIEAQKAHREPAIADTYTMIVRPTINRLGGSS